MTNSQLLENLGIDVRKIKTSGKTICPKCSHTRKNKYDPCLSVDVITGVYNCHNNCGFQGGVTQFVPKPKEYHVPKFTNTTQLSEKTVNWFFSERGITQSVINHCRITESKEWMPQIQKETNTINFNYFRKGELVNIKFRDARKNFKMVKEAELIFYGVDDIVDSDWCVIVEGEIDRLSFLQAGITEVVSVPNGASKSNNANLDYLDNCIEYFDNKKRIILATDDDEVGMSLRDEIARRLGFERCFKVNFDGCKDANEYLLKHGADKLKLVIDKKNLKEFPISGVITADDIWGDVENLFKTGLKRGDTTGKLADFDRLVSFALGQFMVLTGIPNHGKSPFALMIMASLSVRYGWKWGFFTPEHNPITIYMIKICEVLIGKRVREGVGFADIEKSTARSFVNEHFFFIQPEDDNLTLDNILDRAKKLVQQKGIKGLLIDPWNKLEHNIQSGETEHNYVSKELDKVIRFNQRNMVFSIVVAHPKKINKELPVKGKVRQFEVPNLYDISGSSNWFNKPDIGITFYRNYETKLSEVHVQKMKYEHLGEQGVAYLKFNMNNSRFSSQYGKYDNDNWIMNPYQSEMQLDPELIKQAEELNTDTTDDEDSPF